MHVTAVISSVQHHLIIASLVSVFPGPIRTPLGAGVTFPLPWQRWEIEAYVGKLPCNHNVMFHRDTRWSGKVRDQSSLWSISYHALCNNLNALRWNIEWSAMTLASSCENKWKHTPKNNVEKAQTGLVCMTNLSWAVKKFRHRLDSSRFLYDELSSLDSPMRIWLHRYSHS